MITLEDIDIKGQTTKFFAEVSKGSKAALMYDDFIRNTLTKLYANKPCPEQVFLMPSVEEMLKGNFEPLEVIVPGNLEYDGIPIWRGNTDDTSGIVLRGAGYVNGDSRYPCEVSVNDNTVHGILAGATGQGKSVSLNSIIVSACMEYAPWEIQMVLVDAKVVEFKSYASGNGLLPHIASIAATGDAEYIVSVLDEAYVAMMKRNAIFTKAGVKNITEFRKSTKLSMPQVFIVIGATRCIVKSYAIDLLVNRTNNLNSQMIG